LTTTRLSGKTVLVSDFDGTLIEHDLPELVLKRFGAKGWELYDELLGQEKISLEECIRKQYAMIHASTKKEILDYVNDFCVFRTGAAELISWCKQKNIRFVVASAGLDFCIKHAFKANRLRLPELVCPNSVFWGQRGGFRIRFNNRFSDYSIDFKEALVASLKGENQNGKFVIFVGDGLGDLHAAMRSDLVFTIEGSALDRICTERKIIHYSIKDFKTFMMHIDQTAGNSRGIFAKSCSK
jgi:2,3-diketo-5-methylthio-1-phosphopentane phosphatase